MRAANASAAKQRLAGPGYNVQLTALILWSVAAILSLYGVAAAANGFLWLTCALTLPAAYWLIGKGRSYPILLCVLSLCWLQIFADLLDANLRGRTIGPYQAEAVELSLCALLVMAFGMRLGSIWNNKADRANSQTAITPGIVERFRFNRVLVAYFVAVLFVGVLVQISYALPSLRQPLLGGFAPLKFVCLYLLASKVFESRRGYHWLAVALLFEVITGLTGYIATYHGAILVLLIAGVSQSRRGFTAQQILVFVGMIAVLLWTSMIWTAVKPEYRYWANGGTGKQIVDRPFSERVEWMADRIFWGNIDYKDSFERLVARVGYTDYYAQTLARLDSGLIPTDLNLWRSAILHIVTPRALFPEKLAISDSAITTLLTGNSFDKNTSVSVGYVAEAQVDFGFPGMLLPILLVGVMLGAANRYFMTRGVPLVIRQGFATASLLLAFNYGANIDNALGAFVTGFIALALALKFTYPLISKWFSGGRVRVATK